MGKCKTRLAATVGAQAALDIYTFLLQHTATITAPLDVDKYVFYSEKVRTHDLWDDTIFIKRKQAKGDLGNKMFQAFKELFDLGYQRALIVGSDLFDLATSDIEDAFTALETHETVIGPAMDGGYYLLGMKEVFPAVFENKAWGTATVFEDTVSDLQHTSVFLMTPKNDVDYYKDIQGNKAFDAFLPEQFKSKH